MAKGNMGKRGKAANPVGKVPAGKTKGAKSMPKKTPNNTMPPKGRGATGGA